MSQQLQFNTSLRLPVIAAPMFLASGPKLIVETCKAGVIGTFPALNQRSSEGLEQWLIEINDALTHYTTATGKIPAPFGVNLVAHKTNPRLATDLAICIKHKVPLIVTSLGAVQRVVDEIHNYGGQVFHDVINTYHAKKAADVGVDGIIAVAAGAGGHAGTINPFAFVSEIRQFFDKTIVLAGCISNGKDIAAAQMMGADMVYMGTRFLNTQESQVSDAYKKMIVDSSAEDILYTPNLSGVNANFLRPSISNAGLNPDNLAPKSDIDFGQELDIDQKKNSGSKEPGVWKDIWSAGQGVGAINNIPSASELVATLETEYRQAVVQHQKNFNDRFAAVKQKL